MSVEPEALLQARIRVRGPQRLEPAADEQPDADGHQEAADHLDGDGVPDIADRTADLTIDLGEWALPDWPDGVTPAMLAEYDLDPIPVERPGETRRALAAALRCCWPDLDGSPWPGKPARLDAVTKVFASLSRGDAELLPRWAVGALRRLNDSHWVLLDEPRGIVRLGARVALWSPEALTPLREMVRRLPND